MRRFLRPFALLLPLLAACLGGHAAAHPADEDYTLTVSAELFDEPAGQQVKATVYIPTWFLMNEVFQEGALLRDLVGKDDEVKAQIQGWMAYNNPLLADGEPVAPQVQSMEARSRNWPENLPFPGFAKNTTPEDDALERHASGVKLVLAYPLKGMPRTLSFRWRRFITRTTPVGDLSQPSVTLEFYHGDKRRIQDLSAQEPEWIWRSDAVAPAPEAAKVSQVWEPVKWRVAAAPLAVAFGGVVVVMLLGRRRKAVAALVVAADMALVATLGFMGVGFVTTDSPFQKQLARPDPAQVRRVCDGLLRGVYRAFDYDKDAKIYDALTQCVDGPILEQIYKDVHGALVLDDSEGGGAICQVEAVTVDKADLLPDPPAEAGAVTLDCAWSVRGKVSHWSHTHVRANAYAARITLAPRAGKDGPVWKITGCQVTEQNQVEVK